MTKRHEREEKILDRLQKENRALKGENRRLLKKLRELGKGYYKYMVAQDEEQEQEAIQETEAAVEKVCFNCSGEYRLFLIANRRFRLCQSCGKTGKVKIV